MHIWPSPVRATDRQEVCAPGTQECARSLQVGVGDRGAQPEGPAVLEGLCQAESWEYMTQRWCRVRFGDAGASTSARERRGSVVL